MTSLALDLRATLLVLSLTALAAWPCPQEFRLLAHRSQRTFLFEGKRIPLPFGVSKANMRDLLDQVRTVRVTAGLEAIVIFGSRTHFTYGYGPEDRSDLDLLPVFDRNAQPFYVFGSHVGVSRTLKSWSEELPFRVSTPRTELPSLPQLLQEPSPFTAVPTEEAERALHSPPSMVSDARATFRTNATPYVGQSFLVNKEAIVLVDPERVSPAEIRKLRRLGYRNVIPISLNGVRNRPVPAGFRALPF